MSKYIAIIQTGKTINSVFEKHGDFDAFFINHMQIDSIKTKTYHVYETLKFPEIEHLSGVIVTGSPSMVTDKEEWSESTIQWLKQFIDLKIPVLGVCYGHQLLAHALGGKVDWNPNGRQIGKVNMQVTQATYSDPLFSSVTKNKQESIEFLATHMQSIIRLPNDVTLLGSTYLDPNHCFRYKQHIWGTQFHPEFKSEIIKKYIQERSEDIQSEGLNPDELITKINQSKNINQNGKDLLIRFKEICFNA